MRDACHFIRRRRRRGPHLSLPGFISNKNSIAWHKCMVWCMVVCVCVLKGKKEKERCLGKRASNSQVVKHGSISSPICLFLCLPVSLTDTNTYTRFLNQPIILWTQVQHTLFTEKTSTSVPAYIVMSWRRLDHRKWRRHYVRTSDTQPLMCRRRWFAAFV